jgi:hypothetical protein
VNSKILTRRPSRAPWPVVSILALLLREIRVSALFRTGIPMTDKSGGFSSSPQSEHAPLPPEPAVFHREPPPPFTLIPPDLRLAESGSDPSDPIPVVDCLWTLGEKL